MRKFWTTAVLAVAVAATASDTAAQEPNFGRAIAMTEADLLIGQPVNWYGPGVVYAYRLDAGGDWREQERLMATDAGRKDDFGASLALHGNTLVVGAPRKHDGSGVAYVFERDSEAAVWTQSSVIAPPSEGDHSGFATSLAFDGNDNLLVGSPAVDGSGVVYHYHRSGGTWMLLETVRPSDAAGVTSFGSTLGRLGDWLAVGTPAADSAAGRVYFFNRQSGGGWTESAAVTPPAGMEGRINLGGGGILLTGERAFLGAPGAATVLVYSRDAGGAWQSASPITSGDEARGTRFGQTVAAAGGELWVGAPGVNGFNGKVERFVDDGSGAWRSVGSFSPDSTVSSWPLALGLSMASAGDRAVIGMPYGDFGEGRALALSQMGGAWQVADTLQGEIYRIGAGLEPGARCEDGKIEEFTCSNVEVVAHMPTTALGGERGVWVNDVWGWTDPETDRDYALVARRDGASFVDVTNPSAPRLVGNLPRTSGSRPTVWRDIKVIGNYAFIVADGAGPHGMQVFDLTRLRGATGAAATFEPDTTYHEVFSAHNVVADTASGFLYIVGANSGGETCGGGLHMVDAREPLRPAFAGCYNDQAGANSRGYTHDAQCLIYAGPDDRYRGKEICVGSNEKEINIADVSDKANPVTIGRNSYPNVAYAHQGWFDDEQRYFYMNDELDELQGAIEGTRTLVWDLTRLDDPILAREYFGPVMASDHNLFVVGDRVYESNYGSGLRVLDISDRTNPREIAFFDSAPYNNDEPGHSAGQSGAWSNYPFFDSGIVVFTSVREGLFIVRVGDPVPTS